MPATLTFKTGHQPWKEAMYRPPYDARKWPLAIGSRQSAQARAFDPVRRSADQRDAPGTLRQLSPAADMPPRWLRAAECQLRTHALQQKSPSLNHLVGAGEQRCRHLDA